MWAKTTQKTYSSFLQKPDVGQGKSCNYQLPDSEFTYGKSAGEDLYGVRAITSSWQRHTPTRPAVPKKNFKALNKMSVKFGLATSKDFRSFTRGNEHVKLVPNVGVKGVALLLPEEEFAFGLPNRPSTPIRSVMSHEYGNDAAGRCQDIYRNRVMETMNSSRYRPKSTKTVHLGKEATAKKLETLEGYFRDTSSLFKMKKFQTSKPRIDTINRNYVAPNRQQRPQTAQTKLSSEVRRAEL